MFLRKKQKVFCIGRNKTGLTSLGQALEGFGYKLGNQRKSELLLDDWAKKDFAKIIRHCRTADAFKDVPFSLDHTFEIVDQAFPGSKFILSVRENAAEWYDSHIRYDTRALGKGRLPVADDLKSYTYRKPGWYWQLHQYVYHIDESTLYDRDTYIKHYENYNRNVIEYFKNRPDDLLVINLKDDNAMEKLCNFLNIKYAGRSMPHLNKSA